jgi:hypothetical protein
MDKVAGKMRPKLIIIDDVVEDTETCRRLWDATEAMCDLPDKGIVVIASTPPRPVDDERSTK